MARRSAANRKRSWKMERASVRTKRGVRSNKYSRSDSTSRPRKHSRKGLWVGGYTRKDGVRVKGYYRTNAQYRWRR